MLSLNNYKFFKRKQDSARYYIKKLEKQIQDKKE